VIPGTGVQALQCTSANSRNWIAGTASHLRQLPEVRCRVCNALLLIEEVALQALQRTLPIAGSALQRLQRTSAN
jgi:hypothetical protein